MLRVAAAATLTVPTSSTPTLNAAVDAASAGDTVVLLASYDRYAEPYAPVVLDKGLILKGDSGMPVLPAIQAVGVGLAIQDLTLSAYDTDFFWAYDAVYVSEGSLGIRNVVLSSLDDAGVVAHKSSVVIEDLLATGFDHLPPVLILEAVGTAVIRDSLFTDNYDGAVYFGNSDGEVQDCTFSDNTSSYGADVAANGEGHHLLIEGGTFDDARASYLGGSVFTWNMDLTVQDATFSGSVSGDSGGVLWAASDGPAVDVLLDGLSVYSTQADSVAGAIGLWQVDGEVIDSTFVHTSAGGGGALYVEGGEVSVDNCSFQEAWASVSGGAISAAYGADLSVTHSTFRGADADGTSPALGGAIAVQEADLTVDQSGFKSFRAGTGGVLWTRDADVELTDVEVHDTRATDKGGALALYESTLVANRLVGDDTTAVDGGFGYASLSTVLVEDSGFTRSTAASRGGAWLVDRADKLVVRRSTFCANGDAETGGALTATGTDGGELVLTNNLFVANTSDEGGAVVLGPGYDEAGGPVAEVVNNTFVDNLTEAALGVLDLSVETTNNIFMGSPRGLYLTASADGEGGYNLWWHNEVDLVVGDTQHEVGEDAVQADPRFRGYQPASCDSDLHLTPGSPAVNTGDPDLTDVGGGRSDIGAYGGAGSGLADVDGDGWASDLDCNDWSSEQHPGREEVPYDRVDQDCDGFDLCDVDGDGYDAVRCGGGDCDDDEAQVHPDQPDEPNNGRDDDCDGWDDRTWVGGAGCATGPVIGSWAWLPQWIRRRR